MNVREYPFIKWRESSVFYVKFIISFITDMIFAQLDITSNTSGV
jgi:hypothetical protein